MNAIVVARMFDCRCPGDCALQMRCGCFDSGPAYQWVPGLNRRSPQCPADLLLSDHSPHRSFALAQASPLHSRALRLPLPDILLSIRPSMPRHRHSVSCTSSNSNGDRSSKGLAGLLQSSGLHASRLPAQPTSTRNVALSEARTNAPSLTSIQPPSLVGQIKRIS